jgi:hypothetical protein
MKYKAICQCPAPNLSQLGDAQRLANHGAAVRQGEDREGMPVNRRDRDDPERQVVANVPRIETAGQYQNEQQAGRDG